MFNLYDVVMVVGGAFYSVFMCAYLVYLLCVIYTDILVLKKIYHFDIILIYLI